MLFPLSPITIIVGHYGVGKTNFALNIAVDAAKSGKQVTLIDLDVVNPYFRSSEYAELLESKGVRLVSPVFAGAQSNLDSPSLTGAIEPALAMATADTPVIVDAGGDDVGATALGRFAAKVLQKEHQMLYVVNRYRNLTGDATEALEVLREIEKSCHLRATGIVNNSHLKMQTTTDVVDQTLPFGVQVATEAGLPLVATTIPAFVSQPKNLSVCTKEIPLHIYTVEAYVKSPWEA